MKGVLAILSVKACSPALRKQLFECMEPAQYSLINAIVILMIAIVYFSYMELSGNRKEGFSITMDKYRKLSPKQILIIFSLSMITFVSSIVIFEMDKEHGIVKSNIMQKSLDLLIVVISGYLMYNEKLNYKQVIGIILIMIGFKFAIN